MTEPSLRCITATNAGVMTGAGTNTYLLAGGSIVIDPGPKDPAHTEHLVNLAAGNLNWILVTHTHRDHSPGALLLAQETGATIVGMPAPAGENQDQSFVPGWVPAHDELLELGDNVLQAIHTPGHASNHLCYLDVQSGILFSGDHINQGTTVVIAPPDGSMQQYLDSLELLHHYPIRAIAPGHGSMIKEPTRAIDSLIRHRLQRELKTLRHLRELSADGGVFLDILLSRVYSDVPQSLHPIARYSLLAHLLKLEKDGLVANPDALRWQAVTVGFLP